MIELWILIVVEDNKSLTPEELTIFEIEFKVSYPIKARTLFKKRKKK